VGSVGVSYGAHTLERLQGFAPLACIDAIGALLAVLEDLEGRQTEAAQGL
jgi:hypothetical protein